MTTKTVDKKVKYETNIKKVANYFLEKENMSQKKLQKMCFYAYSWYLYFNNDIETGFNSKLFPNDFEGWVHGPVSFVLYKAFPFVGSKPLKVKKSFGFINEENASLVSFLDLVYDTFKEYTGNELEEMTHLEKPWREARIGKQLFEPGHTILKDETIYLQCLELQNEQKD